MRVERIGLIDQLRELARQMRKGTDVMFAYDALPVEAAIVALQGRDELLAMLVRIRERERFRDEGLADDADLLIAKAKGGA